jgi:hypothetical protein
MLVATCHAATINVIIEPIIVANSSDSFRMNGVDLDFWPSTTPQWGNCEDWCAYTYTYIHIASLS